METASQELREAIEVEHHYPATLGSVRAARALVRELCLPLELQERAVLVVSELVANAVVHTASDLCLKVRKDGRLRIEVTDTSPVMPAMLDEPWADHGRGLRIVAVLAARWGVRRLGHGKLVWAELD